MNNTKKRLSLRRTIKSVRRLAQEQPDRTTVLRYFNRDGSCECLIGCAIAEQGITGEDVRGAVFFPSVASVLDVKKTPLNQRRTKWLDAAQSAADKGNGWANAVAFADSRDLL